MKSIIERLKDILKNYQETESVYLEGIETKKGFIVKYKNSMEAEEKRIVEIKEEILRNKKDIDKLEAIIKQMEEK